MTIAFRQVRVLAGERELLAVPRLDLTEQRISVIGPNGGGKSTLLQLVNGLIEPAEGTVTVAGKDTVAEGTAVRRRAGFVFSNPQAQLVMPTPQEDVELSLRRSVKDAAARRSRARACLDELGIGELAGRSSHELSGGQQQLVALATVLVQRPAVLLLDEPTTLLDLANAELFTAVVGRLAAEHGIMVLTATHDLQLAARAERTLLVRDGRVAADGPPAEVIAAYRAQSMPAGDDGKV
ncbi:energy-coupling factor ABC transporter ATP-binding protein [Sediminivirga luteola]|jgi:biotin transport system ATP-binding protein|uniref:ABC transporter ATP-binding protein n=1 Tax=Sediminivirga luteola TaxID=1774748 RepID=A0A8J2TX88_9MICO|nr:ABC transporter ATP-binding protein [Sediminivirga luteola]MCI2265459.1 energy-coupling factor ABC transporter ATP-binding protein [Sediminivirga luteola]GGA10437.1 ABC transporter ATP-binding protein [Sediminivirga luteola]